MALEVPPPEAIPATAPAHAPIGIASIALLVISVAFAVVAQLTLKSAMNEVGHITQQDVKTPVHTIARVAKQPKLWLGLGLFGISALFWLVVLSRVPLSVAYPFVGISYIVIVGLSALFLHEHVPALRWAGVIVVALGIALVGLSFKRLSG